MHALFTGFRIHKQSDCNNIWRTCCALHNLLLERDDLASHWRHGVANPEFGAFEEDDVPEVFTRLAATGRFRGARDLSGMSATLDGGSSDRVVARDYDTAHGTFQAALIENFWYRWNQPRGSPDAVIWPRRNGPKTHSKQELAQVHHDVDD